MSTRKGYSIFQKAGKGAWYVAWADGTGRRRTRKASLNRAIAHQIGRHLAEDADRVRSGVWDPADVAATAHARAHVQEHVRQWEKALAARGNTAKHVFQHVTRVTKLLGMAGAVRLADLESVKVQQALAGVSSPNNARHYLRALRGFVRWCMKTGRLSRDPIIAVEQPRVAGERFQRQPLSDRELTRLVEATETRPCRTFFKGPDRAMYYLTMAYTGMRRNEARRLTPESFEVVGRDLKVFVAAGYSKRRRRDEFTLPRHFRPRLAAWLAAKKPKKPVFDIPPNYRFEIVFKGDCRAAGITPRAGFVLGHHSLRRWSITHNIRTAGLAVAQELARHSTPALTKKYADLTGADRRKAIDAMPDLGGKKNNRKGKKKRRKR